MSTEKVYELGGFKARLGSNDSMIADLEQLTAAPLEGCPKVQFVFKSNYGRPIHQFLHNWIDGIEAQLRLDNIHRAILLGTLEGLLMSFYNDPSLMEKCSDEHLWDAAFASVGRGEHGGYTVEALRVRMTKATPKEIRRFLAKVDNYQNVHGDYRHSGIPIAVKVERVSGDRLKVTFTTRRMWFEKREVAIARFGRYLDKQIGPLPTFREINRAKRMGENG